MKGVIEQDNRNTISSPQCVLPKTVTFVVPALNEEESIADVAQEIAKSIQDSGIDGYEILFVNDVIDRDRLRFWLTRQVPRRCRCSEDQHPARSRKHSALLYLRP